MKCLILSLLLLSSCSNLISKIHKEFDQHDAYQDEIQGREKDRFDRFRRRSYAKRFEASDKATTSNRNYIAPSVKRQYKPESSLRKRFTANDLNDNQSDGSLWGDPSGESSLFSVKNKRFNGDIVLINVMSKLKNEISLELKRAFPAPPKPSSKKNTPANNEDGNAAAPTGAEEETANQEDSAKVWDRISSVIIEQINNNHVLIRGQKQVLFRKRKRLVELQALVAKRDISLEDTVNSDQILEHDINIVR